MLTFSLLSGRLNIRQPATQNCTFQFGTRKLWLPTSPHSGIFRVYISAYTLPCNGWYGSNMFQSSGFWWFWFDLQLCLWNCRPWWPTLKKPCGEIRYFIPPSSFSGGLCNFWMCLETCRMSFIVWDWFGHAWYVWDLRRLISIDIIDIPQKMAFPGLERPWNRSCLGLEDPKMKQILSKTKFVSLGSFCASTVDSCGSSVVWSSNHHRLPPADV